MTLRTKSSLSVYADRDLNLEVRDVLLPDESVTTHAVVIRPDLLVVLPRRWNADDELEVFLAENPHDAVNDLRVTEAIAERHDHHERGPLVASRVPGVHAVGSDHRHQVLMSDVMAAPAFTSERWHLVAVDTAVDTPVDAPVDDLADDPAAAAGGTCGGWRTLRRALVEVDGGRIRDAKTVLALLLLQRRLEIVERVGHDGDADVSSGSSVSSPSRPQPSVRTVEKEVGA